MVQTNSTVDKINYIDEWEEASWNIHGMNKKKKKRVINNVGKIEKYSIMEIKKSM